MTRFTPTAAGHVLLQANPTISGVNTAKTDLFLTELYVEVDPNSFNSSSPASQLALFIPGSLTDGTSVPPTSMPQQIRLHLLTGGSSRGAVTYQLSNVSTYPGLAMNAPTTNGDPNADMYFSTGSTGDTTTEQFTGTGDTVAVLYVNDYAAFGKLSVSIKSGNTVYPLPAVTLPLDATGNKISDRGWRAENAPINDTGLDPGKDEDNTPVMNPAAGQYHPDDGRGFVGDNLTNFEEYRGFVLFNQHVRTNPFHKDVFVEATDYDDDIAYAHPALPTTTHRARSTNADVAHVINTYSQGLPGAGSAAPNGHNAAIALHIIRRGLSPGFLGLEFCARASISSPCVPSSNPELTIFQGSIEQTAAVAGVGQLEIDRLRRSVVAHEVGHSLNLIHNDDPGCIMFGKSFTLYQGFSNIPTAFCINRTLNLIDYPFSTTIAEIPVVNFSETDTLRIKE